MSGRFVHLTTLFLGRLRPPKRLTSTKLDIQNASMGSDQITLETHSRNFQKWSCIFPIFHAVFLLAAGK